MHLKAIKHLQSKEYYYNNYYGEKKYDVEEIDKLNIDGESDALLESMKKVIFHYENHENNKKTAYYFEAAKKVLEERYDRRDNKEYGVNMNNREEERKKNDIKRMYEEYILCRGTEDEIIEYLEKKNLSENSMHSLRLNMEVSKFFEMSDKRNEILRKAILKINTKRIINHAIESEEVLGSFDFSDSMQKNKRINKIKRKEKYEISAKKLGVELINSLQELAKQERGIKDEKKIFKVIKLIDSFKKNVDSNDFNYKNFVDGFWNQSNKNFPKSYDYEHQDELKRSTEVSKNGEIYSQGELYKKEDEERYQSILGGIKSALPKNYFRENLDAQKILDSFHKVLDKTKTGWNDNFDSYYDKVDKFNDNIKFLPKKIKEKNIDVLKRYLDIWNKKYQKLLTEYSFICNKVGINKYGRINRLAADYEAYEKIKDLIKIYSEGIGIIKNELNLRKITTVKSRESIHEKVMVQVKPTKKFTKIDHVSLEKVQNLSTIRNFQHVERIKNNVQDVIKQYTQTNSTFPSLRE